jgi:protein-S-isoprenylcysteine O-methyltransferase Ste14
MHRYFVMASFIAMLASLLIVMIGSFARKSPFVGKVTGGILQFIIGKIGIYGCWTLYLLKAIIPDFGDIEVPVWLSWTATCLLILATFIFIFSFFQLKEAAKMGLPSESTTLKTRGIYAFSRNPLYLAVFIICISSLLYFPNIFNLAFAIPGLIVHHKQTLSEEGFLEQRFGNEWIAYKARVRRYL